MNSPSYRLNIKHPLLSKWWQNPAHRPSLWMGMIRLQPGLQQSFQNLHWFHTVRIVDLFFACQPNGQLYRVSVCIALLWLQFGPKLHKWNEKQMMALLLAVSNLPSRGIVRNSIWSPPSCHPPTAGVMDGVGKLLTPLAPSIVHCSSHHTGL